MESKLCIHTGPISDCYLKLIHCNRDIVICQHSFVLLLFFVKKKSNFTCDVVVDFTHNDFACWLHLDPDWM